MPVVLKERCIEAFEKLHSVGILHGDVELRHMLIGGDGKITIIDFQGSRALIPNDGVMLQKAEPADFLMEMRKVKYKLDYGNAREKEYRKVMISEERAARNKVRTYKHQRRSRGERPGYISDYEDDPKEDKSEPPVHKQDWNEHWVEGADATPRRFVMPGQTPEQLEEEVYRLLAVISRMQLEREARDCGQSDGHYMSTPPPTPTTPSGLQENIKPSLSHSNNPSHSSGLRKRKATASPSAVSSKRPRTSPEVQLSTPATSFADDATSPNPRSMDDDIHPSHSGRNLLRRASHSSESSVPESVAEDVSSPTHISSPSISRYPPIKVRDFAYETYDGPRGYYVPHPPTEARAAKERRWHIARLNARNCWDHNLPHPQIFTFGDAQAISFEKGKKPSVQFGTLKRAREDMENPDGARTSSARKKAKYELAKRAMNGEATTGGSTHVHDNDAMKGRDVPDELPTIPEGPRILSRAEYDARPASAPPLSSTSNPRGILRDTPPVRVVSHRNEDWIGSQLEKSPKLGPIDLYFRSLGNSGVMLGVHYDSCPDDPDGDVPDGLRPSRNDRASDVVAFAALGFKLTGARTRPPKSRLPNPRHVISTGEPPAGSARLPTPIRPPPQRKRVRYGASPGQSSSSTQLQTTVKLQYSSPPPLDIMSSHSACSDAEDERDEMEVESLLQPMTSSVTDTQPSWLSTVLRFFHT